MIVWYNINQWKGAAMEEKTLTYTLKQVSGAVVGGKCRAILGHDEVMGGDEVFAEIAEQFGGMASASKLRHDFEMVLGMIVENTLADGRSRRIGNLMATRLDIVGTFDRLDEAYDKNKHSLRVNFVGLKEAKGLQRSNAPVNILPSPRGRIKAVYSEGGEIGVVHFGRRIVLEGVGMRLSSHGIVALRIYTPEFKDEMNYQCDIVENSDTRLVCEFPESPYLTLKMFLAAKKGKVIRIPWESEAANSRGTGKAIGRHVTVKFAE